MTKTFFLVEMAGIEPASENRFTGAFYECSGSFDIPSRCTAEQAGY